MTYEVVDNIILHAQSPIPGVVCAQYYESSGRLEISVVDLGRGLASSLSETRDVVDDLDAEIQNAAREACYRALGRR